MAFDEIWSVALESGFLESITLVNKAVPFWTTAVDDPNTEPSLFRKDS